MKLSTVVIKTLLGAAFAGLGYFLTYRWFSQIVLFNIPPLLPTLAAFVLGAFSILLLPVLSFKISKQFKSFVTAIVKETLRVRIARSGSKKTQSRTRKVEDKVGELILDTSVIIDGRILDAARVGFLPWKVILPQFVLRELRGVADSKDALKRKRGRHGLDVLEGLKKFKKKNFAVWEGKLEAADVDQQLISLAKHKKARLATVDFNLNKAAKVSGIAVLNINELANALRVILIPGEVIIVKLIQEGKEQGQGVGYLEDGTMIVVEDGGGNVGKSLEVEVTRTFQTEAGRMIFARKVLEK